MEPDWVRDDHEVALWFAEGRSWEWMISAYRTRYGIETTPRMWTDFQRWYRLGELERSHALIPWQVQRQHRWSYAVMMLRTEWRRRVGIEVSPDMRARLDRWLTQLREDGTVVDYDPETGFHYVSRRPGVDLDLIREPGTNPTRQRGSDR
jgi:hypothetical protein